MATVAFAKSTSCLRIELLNYLGDESGDHGGNGCSWSVSKRSADTIYTVYSTRWCCNRHGEDIDFTSFGLGDFWDGQQPRHYEFIYETFGSEGVDRDGGVRISRNLSRPSRGGGKTRTTKIPFALSRLHRDGPDMIIEELGDTVEWGSQYARGMFERVWRA